MDEKTFGSSQIGARQKELSFPDVETLHRFAHRFPRLVKQEQLV